MMDSDDYMPILAPATWRPSRPREPGPDDTGPSGNDDDNHSDSQWSQMICPVEIPSQPVTHQEHQNGAPKLEGGERGVEGEDCALGGKDREIGEPISCEVRLRWNTI